MKERPILFSAPMVRAIIDGTKTQTRRVVKPTPEADQVLKAITGSGGFVFVMDETPLCSKRIRRIRWDCPYGQPGDRLWVRETWAYGLHAACSMYPEEEGPWVYAATNLGAQGRLCDRWRPSIHMRRAASRITLEVTGVRAERLQDISEADAMAEGVKNSLHLNGGRFARENFEHLWWTINGDGSWEANPWVWVIEFQRVEVNV